jgi:DNA adenine methylase
MQQFRETMQNKLLIRKTSYDFADASLYENVNEKTVVYCDPPYIPLNATSYFTDYSSDGFDDNDQIRLKNLAVELRDKGARVIISNHDVVRARELYSDATKIISIDVSRTISANKDSRGKVKELIAIY